MHHALLSNVTGFACHDRLIPSQHNVLLFRYQIAGTGFYFTVVMNALKAVEDQLPDFGMRFLLLHPRQFLIGKSNLTVILFSEL